MKPLFYVSEKKVSCHYCTMEKLNNYTNSRGGYGKILIKCDFKKVINLLYTF